MRCLFTLSLHILIAVVYSHELNLTLPRQVTGKMHNMLQGSRDPRHVVGNMANIYKSIIYIIGDHHDHKCLGVYAAHKKFIAPTTCGNSGKHAIFGPNNGVQQVMFQYVVTSTKNSLTLFTLTTEYPEKIEALNVIPHLVPSSIHLQTGQSAHSIGEMVSSSTSYLQPIPLITPHAQKVVLNVVGTNTAAFYPGKSGNEHVSEVFMGNILIHQSRLVGICTIVEQRQFLDQPGTSTRTAEFQTDFPDI